MERLNVEIPVSVGDKVYRTTSNCEIETGEVIYIKIESSYYMNGNQKLNRTDVLFTVKYGFNELTYKPDALGITVFPTKKGLVKHIVGEL